MAADEGTAFLGDQNSFPLFPEGILVVGCSIRGFC